MNKKELLKEKIELFNYRNNYLLNNNYYDFNQIKDLSVFFQLVFERNGKLPFEEKGKENYIQGRYNSICVEIGSSSKFIKNKETGEIKEKSINYNHIITNDLDRLVLLENKKFVISSPITYIGRNRTSKNARACYGLAFDLDGVKEDHIVDLLHQMNSGWIPKANIIVNSGNGVHLYYLFEKPIALFDNIKPLLKHLKYKLTSIIWNEFTSKIKEPQYQGIFQGFRLPFTKTKFGAIVTAFENTESKYYKVEELNAFIYDPKNRLSEDQIKAIKYSEYRVNKVSLKQAKKLYPDWYERRIRKGEKAGKWNIKRDLYDWWFDKCKGKEIREGHRYFTIMTLAMYAIKCNIEYEKLKEDAYSLLDKMESLSSKGNHFTEKDIDDALLAYKDNYATFPRKDIEKITGVRIDSNKRNYRKQILHLKGARMLQELYDPSSNWRNKDGRPKNSGTKEEIVKKWKEENPFGKKIECERETKLSRTTILKWW